MKYETIFGMALFYSIFVAISAYKMDPFITCLEQNEMNPYGYKEKLTWGNPDSTECIEYPDLCEAYKLPPFPGQGDVCDHADPFTGNIRNACKMVVMFGAVIDEEKTWSWKCADIELSPVKDENGDGTVGCLITNKRIVCYCQEDYCQKNFTAYAPYGLPDNFPPNFTEILALDHGGVPLVVDVRGYEDTSDADTEDSDEETEEDTEEDLDGDKRGKIQRNFTEDNAFYQANFQNDDELKTVNENENYLFAVVIVMSAIICVQSFIIAALCCNKFKTNNKPVAVSTEEDIIEEDVIDEDPETTTLIV